MYKSCRGFQKKEVQRLCKINDSETENAETEVWLDFAKDCSYLNEVEYHELTTINTEVGKLILYMINNLEKFI